jgi:hypothetical protein
LIGLLAGEIALYLIGGSVLVRGARASPVEAVLLCLGFALGISLAAVGLSFALAFWFRTR